MPLPEPGSIEGFTISPEERAMLRKVLSRDLRTPPLTAQENRLIDPLHDRLGEA